MEELGLELGQVQRLVTEVLFPLLPSHPLLWPTPVALTELAGGLPLQNGSPANWRKSTGQCDISEVCIITTAQEQLLTTYGHPSPVQVLSESPCSVFIAAPREGSDCHHPHFMDEKT